MSHDDLMDRAEIKARMKAKGMKQVALANLLGIDPDKVSKSLDAKQTRTFSPEEMAILRQALWQEGDLPAATDIRTVPIIGQVQAGTWSSAVERPIGSMPSPDPALPVNAFGLQIVGDSMDEFVEEGATVLVDPDDKSLHAGRFYVVLNEHGETTFKRFRADPARLEPCSRNPIHEPIVLGDGQSFTIVGRVIWRAARM